MGQSRDANDHRTGGGDDAPVYRARPRKHDSSIWHPSLGKRSNQLGGKQRRDKRRKVWIATNRVWRKLRFGGMDVRHAAER